MAKETKNVLLRLDPQIAERLQTVAEVEGRSVSDLAREAITQLVAQRRTDPTFARLLKESLARHERALAFLSEDDDR